MNNATENEQAKKMEISPSHLVECFSDECSFFAECILLDAWHTTPLWSAQ